MSLPNRQLALVPLRAPDCPVPTTAQLLSAHGATLGRGHKEDSRSNQSLNHIILLMSAPAPNPKPPAECTAPFHPTRATPYPTLPAPVS